MFTKQMEKFVDVLIEKEINKREDKDIVVYGLSLGIEFCFNIFTTIILGFFFEMILQSLVFIVSFSFIRANAGGYHCKKAISCYFMSSGIVVLVLAIVKFTPREYMLVLGVIIMIISILILIKFAPVETPSKALDEEEQKNYHKKTVIYLSIECATIPILFLAGIYSLAFIVCLGITVSAGLVFLQIKLSL